MAKNFGVYNSVRGATAPHYSWTLEDAHWHLTKERVNPVQEQQDYKNGSSLVACFGAYCPTNRRKVNADNEISGLVGLDFDHIPEDQVLEFLEQIKLLPYVLLAWPSGSYYRVDDEKHGGLKLVVEPELPPISPESYECIFAAVSDQVKKDIPALAAYWDAKCKDLTRLCFLSYAHHAWLNPLPQKMAITN